MNRVRNTEPLKRLSLQLQQILSAVVHSTTDATILPAGMLQSSQLIELLANSLGRPSFRGQCEITDHSGPALHKLILQVFNRGRDLLVNLAAHTGEAQEERVTE